MSVTHLCLTLCDPEDGNLPGSFVHGISQGKDAGVGNHSLLQGIFPNQGSNSGLLHCRQNLCWVSHQGTPSINHSKKPPNTAFSCSAFWTFYYVVCSFVTCCVWHKFSFHFSLTIHFNRSSQVSLHILMTERINKTQYSWENKLSSLLSVFPWCTKLSPNLSWQTAVDGSRLVSITESKEGVCKH